MAAYATVAQLIAYTGQPEPQDAERLLQRASEVVDEAMMTARYRVDVNGLPTDTDVINAFANAVCAQVEWWEATDDELAQQDRFESMSFEGVSLSRGGRPTRRLCERARAELRDINAIYLSRGVTT